MVQLELIEKLHIFKDFTLDELRSFPRSVQLKIFRWVKAFF